MGLGNLTPNRVSVSDMHFAELNGGLSNDLLLVLDPDTLYIEECNRAVMEHFNITRPKDLVGVSLIHLLVNPCDVLTVKLESARAPQDIFSNPLEFKVQYGTSPVWNVCGQFSASSEQNGSLFLKMTPLCNVGHQRSEWTIYPKSTTTLPHRSNLNIIHPLHEFHTFKPKQNPLTKTSYRILIAEDDEAGGIMLREYLTHLGLEADWIHNGQQALDLALQNDYQIILLDGHMPVMNGVELTNKLRNLKKYKNIPIIAITGSSIGTEFEAINETDINHILLKPYNLPELKEVVFKFLPTFQAN